MEGLICDACARPLVYPRATNPSNFYCFGCGDVTITQHFPAGPKSPRLIDKRSDLIGHGRVIREQLDEIRSRSIAELAYASRLLAELSALHRC